MNNMELIFNINSILPTFPKHTGNIQKEDCFTREVRNYLKLILEKLKSSSLFDKVVFCRTLHWSYTNSIEGEWFPASPEYFKSNDLVNDILTYYFLLKYYNSKHKSPLGINSLIFKSRNIAAIHKFTYCVDKLIYKTIIKNKECVQEEINIELTQNEKDLVDLWKKIGNNLHNELLNSYVHHKESSFCLKNKSLEEVTIDNLNNIGTSNNIELYNILKEKSKKVRSTSFPSFLLILLSFLLQSAKKKQIYFIPSGFLYKSVGNNVLSNQNVEGFGGISIIFDRDVHREELKILKLITDITWSKLGIWEGELKTMWETVRHGTKSAMTAIMSRNLSHNIGSHVISYWNNRLEEQLKRVPRELKNELSGLKEKDLDRPTEYTSEQKVIKSSRKLLQYIQQRMDFVAELSTSVPCSEMSMDIEKDIVNPFIEPNNDKYGRNHTEISPMLSYIAHSEKIDLHGRIKFEIKEGIKDRRVSIPNGVIGIHAVYSILENFIRNAAKHYKKANSQPGVEHNNKIIKIEIDEIDEFKQDYLVMRVWDLRENSCDSGVIKELRQYLPGGELCQFSEKGSLSQGGWGIKEMVTCANFLRKSTPGGALQSSFASGWNT